MGSGKLMKMTFVFLVAVTIGRYVVECSPLLNQDSSRDPAGISDIDSKSLSFLIDKGYLDTKVSYHVGSVQGQKPVVEALKSFQKFLGIPPSGRLDEETRRYIVKPRCGMADVKSGEARRRKRRYNHQGTTWKNTDLTWALETSNNDGIPDVDVRRILTAAFHKWSSVTNINFRELVGQPDNTADIRVRFVRLKHGDPYAFDGPGGTLAHAFYPLNNLDLSGDIHFESADFKLTYDDILGAQLLYGGKVRPKPKPDPEPQPSIAPRPTGAVPRPTVPAPRPTEAPTRCATRMRAPFIGMDGRLYFFNSDRLYTSYDTPRAGIESGPLPISTYFRGVKKVDAVFTHPYYRSHTVFHGNTFHTFEENKVRFGGERKIKYGFQGLGDERSLENIDAAIAWPQTGQLYLFKNDSYWRFRRVPGTRDYRVDRGYPQIIARKWRGLPESVDSAFAWGNGKVYFTKGDLYYRWDERKNVVHSGYPVKLSRSFLKCSG